MNPAQVVFWACLFLVCYAYLLYPVVLFLTYVLTQIRSDWAYLTGRRNRRSSTLSRRVLPSITMIVAAYNEEQHLRDKITNIQKLDYPPQKMQVIFISDGSTDGTNQILKAVDNPNIRAVFLRKRMGKAAALNYAVKCASSDIFIFSDAATLFAPSALQKLVRHFDDPRVGIVCGALDFQGSTESRQTEGVYWKYESMLRLMEARLGATLTASGAIYALRRKCYLPLAADAVIEDFVIPMNARRLGYEVVYDPEAVATDFAAASVRGEFTRRVRLAVGSFRNISELIRTPLPSFTRLAFFSHKLLRWVVPILLIGMFVSNALLWDKPLYRIAFTGQLVFYLWAGIGFLFHHRLQRVRFALVGYFLLAMNLAFLVGFIRVLFGRTQATWERAH